MKKSTFDPHKRIREEHSIQDILQVIAKGYNLENTFDKLDIREAWTKLLGPGVAKYTKSVELKREVLYVYLSSAILKEELSYGKQKIINLLNEEMKKNVVKDLVLR